MAGSRKSWSDMESAWKSDDNGSLDMVIEASGRISFCPRGDGNWRKGAKMKDWYQMNNKSMRQEENEKREFLRQGWTTDRLNLGMRLHDTPPMGLEERLCYIKNQGFSCAHVALSKVLGENESADMALTPGYGNVLRRMFSAQGIELAVLGCYLNLANPDRQQLAAIQKRYMAHIRLAAIAGCGVVGTETGAPNTEYRFVPECHTEEAFRSFLYGLKPVVRYAEQMGVIIGIEPVATHIVHTPKLARRMLDEIASPNLQIIFDPVNLLYIENYEKRDEILGEATELLAEEIAVVHIKDFRIEKGKLDYAPILKFLKEKKPWIACTLEDTTPENAMEAAGYIHKIYEEA